MTETWSVLESWLILRDHLCRGQADPFLIYAWDREQRQRAQASSKSEQVDTLRVAAN